MHLQELCDIVKMKIDDLETHKVSPMDVEVVIRAAEDGVLEVSMADLEEMNDDEETYREHIRKGGKREFSFVIEGV